MIGRADPDKLANLSDKSHLEDNSEKRPKNIYKNTKKIVEVVMPAKKKPVAPSADKVGEIVATPTTPVNPVVEVPFVNVRPLTEVQRRDVPREKHIPAYRTKAPVEANLSTKEMLDLILNTGVSATVGQLLGSSPALLKELTRHVSKVRVPVKPVVSSNVNIAKEEDRRDWYDEYIEDDEADENISDLVDPRPTLSELSKEVETLSEPSSDLKSSREPDKPAQKRVRIEIQAADLPKCTSFCVLPETNELGEKGTIIVTDPIVQYLDSLADTDEKVDVRYVASDARKVRVVYPIVNGLDREESLLDGGSEICSMAKRIAMVFGINWSPDITINMEDAHGNVERTLGLARNVTFDFGGLIFLLQLHIIDDPPYNILLGRPFEVVSASNIKNEHSGDQTITLTDPRNGNKLVLPTYDRGKPPTELRKVIQIKPAEQSFQVSMI